MVKGLNVEFITRQFARTMIIKLNKLLPHNLFIWGYSVENIESCLCEDGTMLVRFQAIISEMDPITLDISNGIDRRAIIEFRSFIVSDTVSDVNYKFID